MMTNSSNNTAKEEFIFFDLIANLIINLLKIYWKHMELINIYIIIYLILKTITKLNTIINKIENIKINLDYCNTNNKIGLEENMDYQELYQKKREPNEKIVITSDEDTKKSSNCKYYGKKLITQKLRKKNKKKIYKTSILDILMTDSESDVDLHYNDSNTESKEDNSDNEN